MTTIDTMQAGRELDALVAELMGWRIIDVKAGLGASDRSGLTAIQDIPHYSTDLALGLQLAERFEIALFPVRFYASEAERWDANENETTLFTIRWAAKSCDCAASPGDDVGWVELALKSSYLGDSIPHAVCKAIIRKHQRSIEAEVSR